jgi:hypothetical protein
MIVSAHQPSYFAWLGWLDKVARSDLFILMDDVQLSDSAYQHRNILLTREGKEKFLTIPIRKKGYLAKSLKDINISTNIGWQENHFQFIKNSYNKHPFYAEVIFEIEPFFYKKFELLGEALVDVCHLILKLFDIPTRIVRQSDLIYPSKIKKNDLILELVTAVKANVYLSGQGAKSYLDLDKFAAAGIDVIFQEFSHPIYPQINSIAKGEFITGMSSLDALFNLGIEASKKLIHEHTMTGPAQHR